VWSHLTDEPLVANFNLKILHFKKSLIKVRF
jgi:hypothetical protein